MSAVGEGGPSKVEEPGEKDGESGGVAMPGGDNASRNGEGGAERRLSLNVTDSIGMSGSLSNVILGGGEGAEGAASRMGVGGGGRSSSLERGGRALGAAEGVLFLPIM